MKYLNEKQASEYLELPPSILGNLRRKGKGPTYIRMGAASLYTSEALDAYVLACTHVSSVSAQPIETVTEETDHV